tara:strand:- start:1451 stop:2089 length:639 start_codon:yes stop_codon:yes gene_type:complete
MANPFNENSFHQLPLVVILRGFDLEQACAIVRACQAGGLTTLEITMNSQAPETQIQEAIQVSGGRMNIGAGTVTSPSKLESALGAGASFIVTPTLDSSLVSTCRTERVPIFPGAWTPTEIHQAWDAGAHMVKVFPSHIHGPKYIKALRGPFPDIPLMPTGGVNLDTIGDYLKAGASGFGIGSPVLNPERIRAKDWAWLTDQVERFREIYSDF